MWSVDARRWRWRPRGWLRRSLERGPGLWWRVRDEGGRGRARTRTRGRRCRACSRLRRIDGGCARTRHGHDDEEPTSVPKGTLRSPAPAPRVIRLHVAWGEKVSGQSISSIVGHPPVTAHLAPLVAPRQPLGISQSQGGPDRVATPCVSMGSSAFPLGRPDGSSFRVRVRAICRSRDERGRHGRVELDTDPVAPELRRRDRVLIDPDDTT